jgi:hypothetical protein
MDHLSCCRRRRLLVVSPLLYYSAIGVALPKVLRASLHSSHGMCVSATKDLLDVSAKVYRFRFEETCHWVLERPTPALMGYYEDNFTKKCFKQVYPEAYMIIS